MNCLVCFFFVVVIVCVFFVFVVYVLGCDMLIDWLVGVNVFCLEWCVVVWDDGCVVRMSCLCV